MGTTYADFLEDRGRTIDQQMEAAKREKPRESKGNMHKITFYIGLQQKDGLPVEDGKENSYIEQFCLELSAALGGCTMWEAKGMWAEEGEKESDRLVTESSLVIETIEQYPCLWQERKERVLDVLSLLKTAINQTAILYTVQELVEVDMVL